MRQRCIPTLYRLNEKGYLEYEQIKVGVKRTRVYYSITESGFGISGIGC